MDYYFTHVGLSEPDFGFSPDAEFPIINGEKVTLQNTSTSQATTTRVRFTCTALQVVCVKTWYRNLQQQ